MQQIIRDIVALRPKTVVVGLGRIRKIRRRI